MLSFECTSVRLSFLDFGEHSEKAIRITIMSYYFCFSLFPRFEKHYCRIVKRFENFV